MKSPLFLLCALFALGSAPAPAKIWQPGPGLKQVPIWPGAVPDPLPNAPSPRR